MGKNYSHLVQVCMVVSDRVNALFEILGGEILIGVPSSERLDSMLFRLDFTFDGVARLAGFRRDDLHDRGGHEGRAGVARDVLVIKHVQE
eukprot:scaffold240392_cov33-Tisochrysis_lutea.AAC.6